MVFLGVLVEVEVVDVDVAWSSLRVQLSCGYIALCFVCLVAKLWYI